MKTEYEIKVLEINHDEIVSKLNKLGATKVSDTLQERFIYDCIPKTPHKWIRLRTNGEKTTLTIKDLQKQSIDGMKEIEIGVSDFYKTNELLENLGYKHKGFQQNKRIQYILDDIEIDLDTWPSIPEYMEIEGECEESVRIMLEKLGIPEEKVTVDDVDSIYKHYGINETKYLRFEEEDK